PGVSEQAKSQLLAENNLQIKQSDYPEPGSYLVSTENLEETVTIANKLHESEAVEFAQPNFVRLQPRLQAVDLLEKVVENGGSLKAEVSPTAPPTDPGYASQWSLPKIKAPEAFDISMGSPTISIAIIDEGCDLSHEDISYKLPGYDAVYRTDNPSPLPRDGHGTSCAGISAMIANNGKGGSGVAPKSKVLPVRIAYGSGGGWVTSDAIIADGIRKAVERGGDVLSNSWGGGSPSTAITNAFKYAQTTGRGGKGCPIAAATGNLDQRGVIYPANLSPTIPGLMAVGASNQWDQRKSKTSLDGENWGSTYGPEVDVVAPGVKIYTTDIMAGGGYSSGNYVPNFNGTSSATPHVAGLMGLILSVDPDLRSWEVEEIIKQTADHLGTPGRNEEFGFGRINCRRALEAASRIWYEISIVPEFLGSGKDCYLRINVRMYNPGINTVRLDGLTIASHSPDGSTQVDRFEYRPNPGNVLAPRSTQDVRFNRILLKANGNQSSWSYRWSMNWSYTFWRPGAPGLPLSAEPLSESAGQKATSIDVRGDSSSKERKSEVSNPSFNSQVSMTNGNGATEGMGDLILVDLQAKTIKISLR
ncbi:MAG: S8 family serine peptidase, partial [Phormidium sp.]